MGVRVKLKIRLKTTGRGIVTSTLVNPGFEADQRQLMIPIRLAKELGLWLSPKRAISLNYGTVGGEITFVIPNELFVQVTTDDKKSKELLCDAVILTTEPEVLINDYLREDFMIETN